MLDFQLIHNQLQAAGEEHLKGGRYWFRAKQGESNCLLSRSKALGPRYGP